MQKPFEGLTGLRTPTSFSKNDFEISGTLDLTPVKGREAEICATFEIGTSEFGFNIFKSAASEGKIYYSPASGELIADFSNLTRLSNDDGVYDGIYRCTLPEKPAIGDKLKLNIFIDHSILDIFVNDKWATSIRVFPTDENAYGIEVYSTTSTKALDLKAWILDVNAASSGIDDIWFGKDRNEDRFVDVYNLQGVKIRSKLPKESATENLPSGLYIVGDKKVLVRQ